MYVWLAAVTGARRGELCGLQWADIDLDADLVHIAFSYLVRAGQNHCVTTPPASCWPAASTCATRQHAWVMAAARPRCATMPTRCPRSTGVLPPTSPS